MVRTENAEDQDRNFELSADLPRSKADQQTEHCSFKISQIGGKSVPKRQVLAKLVLVKRQLTRFGVSHDSRSAFLGNLPFLVRAPVT